MYLFSKLKKYLFHPKLIFNHFLALFLDSSFSVILTDKFFIKIQYQLTSGKRLNLTNPVYFSEKISWMKLYNRNPEYTKMADKYEVRNYIEENIGGEYLIPLLGIYNSFDEIDFRNLPNQFVIKCTHDSGSFVICRNKAEFDMQKAKERITNKLKHNYFYHGREWVYKNIVPRIIIQKYMENESDAELKDYKIFCFNGEPKIIQVDFDKFTDYKQNYYSPDWEILPLELRHPSHREKIDKPGHLSLMLQLASKLSKGFPFIRTDFFIINDEVFFGEFTFYPENGFWEFKSLDNKPEWNEKIGSWIELPSKT